MEQDSNADRIFRWRWVEDFLLEVSSTGTIRHSRWDAFIAEFTQRRGQTRGVIILTKGAGPSASQRAALRNIINQGAPLPAVILHDSRITRGILSALNLLLAPESRPQTLAPAQLDEAFDLLQVPPEARSKCVKAIMEMQRELGMNLDLGERSAMRMHG